MSLIVGRGRIYRLLCISLWESEKGQYLSSRVRGYIITDRCGKVNIHFDDFLPKNPVSADNLSQKNGNSCIPPRQDRLIFALLQAHFGG